MAPPPKSRMGKREHAGSRKLPSPCVLVSTDYWDNIEKSSKRLYLRVQGGGPLRTREPGVSSVDVQMAMRAGGLAVMEMLQYQLDVLRKRNPTFRLGDADFAEARTIHRVLGAMWDRWRPHFSSVVPSPPVVNAVVSFLGGNHCWVCTEREDEAESGLWPHLLSCEGAKVSQIILCSPQATSSWFADSAMTHDPLRFKEQALCFVSPCVTREQTKMLPVLQRFRGDKFVLIGDQIFMENVLGDGDGRCHEGNSESRTLLQQGGWRLEQHHDLQDWANSGTLSGVAMYRR